MKTIEDIKKKLKSDYKFNYEHYGAVEAMNSLIDSLLERKK